MSKTKELIDWTFEKICLTTIKSLKKNEFAALYCQTAKEACKYIVKEAAEAKTIAIGGSMTLAEMKVTDQLKELIEGIMMLADHIKKFAEYIQFLATKYFYFK